MDQSQIDALTARMAAYEEANNDLRDELMKALIDATETSSLLVDVHELFKELWAIPKVPEDSEEMWRWLKVRDGVAKHLGLDIEPVAGPASGDNDQLQLPICYD